jgi:hypothetical protein
MTSESVMVGLRQAGWSLAEWSTDRGCVAHAEQGGHRITITAPSSVLAWLVLWRRVTSGRG